MNDNYNSHFRTICSCCRGAGYTVKYETVTHYADVKRVDGMIVQIPMHEQLERKATSCYHCRGTGYELK